MTDQPVARAGLARPTGVEARSTVEGSKGLAK